VFPILANLLGCIGANFVNLLMFQYHQFVGMWGQQIIEHDVQWQTQSEHLVYKNITNFFSWSILCVCLELGNCAPCFIEQTFENLMWLCIFVLKYESNMGLKIVTILPECGHFFHLK
jgi:hypothetical protein